ncbi:MAG: flagellar motor switch protein FliM [Armatimonadota bacterium]
MSELLSQDEINALLSAFESVTPEEKNAQVETRRREVRLYDFSKPDRFSKEHLRTINIIHSNFATGLTAQLSGSHQVPVQVSLISVGQVSYKDYLASIPAKTMLAEIQIPPLDADILFEVNPSIIGVWVDYLCGSSLQIPSQPSDLTLMDMAVAKRVLNTYLQVYRDSWASTVKLDPEVRRVVNSETYDGMLLPSETVLACSYEVHAGQSVGTISICIPSVAVESILPALSSARTSRLANRRQSKTDAVCIKKVIDDVSLPCRALLGRASISVADILNLKVGDLIRTTSRADAEVELWIGDDHLGNGTPGLRGNNLSVMVSETSRQDASEEEPMPEGEMLAQAA